MSVDSESVCGKVAAFLDRYPSGWIKEADFTDFLSSEVSLRDLFMVLSSLSHFEKLNVLLNFLENIIVYWKVCVELLSPPYSQFVLSAARSPSERLRTIVADAIVKANSHTEISADLLLVLFTDEDTGISTKMSKIIVSRSSAILPTLLLHYPTISDETVKFRFLALFIEIGKLDQKKFEVIQSEKIYDEILTQLRNEDDLLVKLGSLSLVEALAEYRLGSQFLNEANVLGILDSELQSPLSDSTTLISLIYSMGNIIAQGGCFVNGRFESLLNEFMVSRVSAERKCAIKVVASLSFAPSRNVESFLVKNWKLFDQIIYALTDFTDPEIVNCALDAVVQIVRGWEANPFTSEAGKQLALSEQLVTTFARHPFPETRALVYSALAAFFHVGEISDQASQNVLEEASAVRIALLNAHSESTSEGRVAKCDFVRVLVNERLLEKFFGKDQISDLVKFAETGIQPFIPDYQVETDAF